MPLSARYFIWFFTYISGIATTIEWILHGILQKSSQIFEICSYTSTACTSKNDKHLNFSDVTEIENLVNNKLYIYGQKEGKRENDHNENAEMILKDEKV